MSFNPREITLAPPLRHPGLVDPGLRGIEIRIHRDTSGDQNTRYQDIHLTKIFTRGQTIIFSFVNCFWWGEERLPVSGPCVTLFIRINWKRSEHLWLFWIKATHNQITTSPTGVSVPSSLTFTSPRARLGKSTRFKWSCDVTEDLESSCQLSSLASDREMVRQTERYLPAGCKAGVYFTIRHNWPNWV